MSKAVTTNERLILIEEQMEQNGREHRTILVELGSLNTKLDTVIDKKADQSDVDSINSKMWAFAMVFFTAFVGLIVWLVQAH